MKSSFEVEKTIIFVKNKIKKSKYNVVSDIIIKSNIFIRVLDTDIIILNYISKGIVEMINKYQQTFNSFII
jgi:hypothetical protein